MIDPTMVDELYKELPNLHFGLFDRRSLVPLDDLPEWVTRESRGVVDAEWIRVARARIWFPVIPMSGSNDGRDGVPLYVPSRLGLFAGLQRDGFTVPELTIAAELEESLIENVITVEDLTYDDDDLTTVAEYTRGRLEAFNHMVVGDDHEQARKRVDEQSKLRRRLAVFEEWKVRGIPEKSRQDIARDAFRVRAFNENLRFTMLQTDRLKLEKGYGVAVVFGRHTLGQAPGEEEAGQILWENTVQDALAYFSPAADPPIRLPGLLLRGSSITTTKMLRPAEYQRRWEAFRIDEYLTSWPKVSGARFCLNCGASFGDSPSPTRRFCDDRCRQAAKQRRYRKGNPEAIERTQQKYWKSIDL